MDTILYNKSFEFHLSHNSLISIYFTFNKFLILNFLFQCVYNKRRCHHLNKPFKINKINKIFIKKNSLFLIEIYILLYIKFFYYI